MLHFYVVREMLFVKVSKTKEKKEKGELSKNKRHCTLLYLSSIIRTTQECTVKVKVIYTFTKIRFV